MLVSHLKPPYYAVIFSSVRTEQQLATRIESSAQSTAATALANKDDHIDYQSTAERMMELAAQQDGFLGVESAREEIGITVSYWRDLAAIKQWQHNAEHQWAKQQGKANWYRAYRLRIAKVEHDYGSE